MKIVTYPGYLRKNFRWKYVQQVYDGTAFDYYDGETVDSASQVAKKFFPKKTQRETDESYKERLKLIDPAVYFATGVESINGVLFSAEAKAERQFSKDGTGLGDEEDVDSKLYNLLNNVDGSGGSYYSLPKKASLALTLKHTVYGLVEGVQREGENVLTGATIHLLNPEAVINKIYENGRLVACRLEELRDERTSLDDATNPVKCYTDYTLDGWRRFKRENDVETELGSGEYAYYATAERKERILPIFEVSLDIDRQVGYIWAKKCIAIANAESQLDHAHRNVSFQLLRIVAGKEQYQDIIDSLKKGSNAMRQEPEARHQHDFFGPSSEFFESSANRIKERIKNFFHGMFKDFGDAAKERTATEIRLESQSGIEAFLTLLAESVDEFENKALWRYMQAELPDEPQYWGDAFVRRPADFSPVDVDAIAEKLANRYITGLNTVPIDTETLATILGDIYKSDGIPAPEREELLTLAESYLNNRSQERDVMAEIGG